MLLNGIYARTIYIVVKTFKMSNCELGFSFFFFHNEVRFRAELYSRNGEKHCVIQTVNVPPLLSGFVPFDLT